MTQSTKNIWYIQFGKSEFGPLSEREAVRVIKSGRFSGPAFVHRFGSDKWIPIEEVAELKSISDLVEEYSPKDGREGNRFTMLSTCRYTYDDNVGMGVCRDISETGIYIISNIIPPVGTSVEVSILPLDTRLEKEYKVTGKVQRLAETREGFAVQFETASSKLLELLRAQKIHQRAE